MSIILAGSFKTDELSLEYIRKNYEISVSDKKVCQSMIEQLSHHLNGNVHLAYLGAFQTIWANHTGNPFEKLKTFNKGKKNIDKAATLSPNNVEIIFIRYSIQKQSPKFLGYKDHLKEDEAYLSKTINDITDTHLKSMVQNILNN